MFVGESLKIILTCVLKTDSLVLDEKNWLDAFWTYLLGETDWSCDQVNNLFFTCQKPNQLQSIYNGIAGNAHWDLIGTTNYVNSDVKGLVS